MNRVELGRGVCQTRTSAAMPASGWPLACLSNVLNDPIFNLDSVNFTRCIRRPGAATSGVACAALNA
jgi:hypothetical protein